MRPRVSIYGKTYHGRHAERRRLDDLYESSLRGSQTLYIRGYSGVGKTSLVESRDWEEEKNCYCVSGKFEEHMARPYSGITQALSALSLKWAASPAGARGLQKFLGDNSRDEHILRLFLPNLYNVSNADLGREDEKVTYEEIGNNRHEFERWRRVVFKILEQVVVHDRPVIILFNDLHWADQPSLDLIQFLIEENLRGLFLVTTFRTEEVGEGHILNTHSKRLMISQKADNRFHQMELLGFDLDELNDIFSQLTSKKAEATLPLVKVIHAKTNGNPFFVEQFFHLLQQEGYLQFSYNTSQWEWTNVNEIQNAMSIVSSEVADLVANSMRSLNKHTQEILKVAACLGAQVPLPVLKRYFAELKWSNEETKIDWSNLEETLEEQVETQVLKRSSDSSLYFWAHDKLNQAALMLLPSEEKEALHLRLGTLVVQMSEEETRAMRKDILIYIAADQLNRVSLSVLTKEGVVLDLVRLNLQAAKLSKSKSAFYTAADLLRKGIHLMRSLKEISRRESSAWVRNHELWMDLFNNLLETEYIIGNHGGATDAIAEILRRSTSLDEEFRAQSCQLEIMTNGKVRDYDGAIALCLQILKAYSLPMPRNPKKIQVSMEKRRVKKALPTGEFNDLLRFPLATSTREQYVSVFLAKLSHLALLGGNLRITRFAGLRAIRHASEFGLTSYTAMALGCFAASLREQGKNEEAYTYGELSEGLLKQLSAHSNDNHAKILVIIHSSVIPLKKPLQDSLEPFMESYRVGMKSGEVEFAFVAAMNYGYHYFFSGLPLGPIAQDMESYGHEARQFGVTPSISVQFPIMLQTALNLQGKSSATTRLKGEAMDQAAVLQEVAGRQTSMTLRDICTFRLMLAYIFRDLDTLREMLEELSTFPVFNVAIARSHLRQAFTSLGGFLLYRNTKQKKWWTIANHALEYFHDAVTKGSMNAYPIYCLLLAEKTPSKQKYDEAIRVCSRSGLLNFEAIANENVGLYFDVEGDTDWASFYVTRCLKLYEEWGALGKVATLQNSLKHLLGSSAPSTTREQQARSGTTHLGRTNYRKSIASKIRMLSFESQKHLFGRNGASSRQLQSTTTPSSLHSGALPAFEEGSEKDEAEESSSRQLQSTTPPSSLHSALPAFEEGSKEGEAED